ncbi:MAG TPA: TatD family hydrolase [Acidobacteriota bacterium]|nr:TatD family hydrolase [Acidobacteriota bacterium]
MATGHRTMETSGIIDSHAHLDMPQFDPDRDMVIERARQAGVTMILSIGTGNPSTCSIEKTLELTEEHSFIYAGIGVHPHDARTADSAYWKKMERWAEHPKVRLWGEIGLDYYYDLSPRETQREVFVRQIQMSKQLGLPVSIHCRDAWPDLIQILRQEWKDDGRGGILHSFSGNRETALECTAMGFMVSFSGMVTFKNAESVRAVARSQVRDKMLVETDSPYLAPVPHRGKRNEPAFVVDVARSLAQTIGIEFDTLAHKTTANLLRLVGPAEGP